MIAWGYAETVNEARRRALVASMPFDDICERIADGSTVLCGHRPRCDDNARFSRVVFCIVVAPTLFDLFYNSPSGYRGAYFRSPYEGLEANARFLGRISPVLVRWAGANAPDLDLNFAKESLNSPSAKAWLAEYGTHLCSRCEGEVGNPSDERPEVLNGRWEIGTAADRIRGRKAPCVSKIKVFGAFLDERHNEFTPERKRRRAMQIHESGWS